ncbi:MAG: translation initiation factor IF-2 [Candidatus Campbellbacteria bacterium]|nr:translation initiation factor IF-2 [Candidatus Campbellbacteria bacterium]
MTALRNKSIERPPIVVVLGHVDHGKSSLLDYVRKTNIVATEAGGITQHTAAYEVVHKDKTGALKKITFIDTPGHEAFKAQRQRGASVADIAILVVSAEDGVKAQTKEAVQAIEDADIPYIVAINKIDAPNANVERTVANLIENSIFVEGHGGSTPYIPISAKKGTGIDELLEMILLVASLEELHAEPDVSATGIIIEAHRDAQKGISATFIITNGTLSKGSAVSAGKSCSPVRALYDFKGEHIETASVCAPVTIIGWNELPEVGSEVHTFDKKKDAEAFCAETVETHIDTPVATAISPDDTSEHALVPIVIKADVSGSLDAIAHEIAKIQEEKVDLKIILTGVGPISENDVKRAGGDVRTVIIGFNTSVETEARLSAERVGMTVHTETIIYKLTEWLAALVAQRKPKETVQEVCGQARVLKLFSVVKTKQVLGARVDEGAFHVGDTVTIVRREEEIGHGRIVGLQKDRDQVKQVPTGTEFGGRVDSPTTIATGDTLISYTSVTR